MARGMGNSRSADEAILRMLRDHVVHGLTRAEVAERHGLTKGQVCGALHRIEKADLDESGEPRGHVALCYSRGAGAQS